MSTRVPNLSSFFFPEEVKQLFYSYKLSFIVVNYVIIMFLINTNVGIINYIW